MAQERITGDELDAAAQQIADDSETMHSIVHGAPTAPDVPTEGGDVPPLGKVVAAMNALWGPGLISGDGVPDDSLGIDGQHYLNLLDGSVYKKASGVWGSFYVPATNRIYAVVAMPDDSFGADGDLAIMYASVLVSSFLEKSGGTWQQLAQWAGAWAHNVLELTDNFIGNTAKLEADGIFGEAGWLFHNIAGVGTVRMRHDDGTDPSPGTCQLTAEAGAGNASCLTFQHDGGGNGFYLSQLAASTDNVLSFVFKLKTASQCHLGFTNSLWNATDPVLNRFGGLFGDGEAGGNFLFRTIEGGTVQDTDLLLPVDTEWHTLRIRTSRMPENNYHITLDGQEFIVANPSLSGSVQVSAMTVSTAAAAGALHLNSFKLAALY